MNKLRSSDSASGIGHHVGQQGMNQGHWGRCLRLPAGICSVSCKQRSIRFCIVWGSLGRWGYEKAIIPNLGDVDGDSWLHG